ncbi:MAG: type III polyketide synthase [Rhodospirillaceae bacterium]
MLIATDTSLPLSRAAGHQAPVHIAAVGTAYPEYCFTQEEALRWAGRIFGHNPDLMARMSSAYGNAGVRQRYSCVPLSWYAAPHGWPERMRLYEEHALALLTRASRHALSAADVDARDVAATVTVSSTGIATPSLDSLLQDPLGLSPSVQRLPVFGLGCAGGVVGLSRAAALARAMSGRWVLFLCVELCGLTFRAADDSKQNVIATAIFGDGAAAILLRSDGAEERALSRARILDWGEHTWPGTRDIMGWKVEDDGLGVIFSRSIPHLVRTQLRPVTDAFLHRCGLSRADLSGLIVHPGGEKVLEALEQAFELPTGSLEHARGVLADYGNMSAVTVLAVLERTLAAKARGTHLMTALGPGFSAAMCLLDLG